MARLNILHFNSPPSVIKYSVVSGEVWHFTCRGIKFYDEDEETAIPEWEATLQEFIVAAGLNLDKGKGLLAFIKPYMEKKFP
jgi:hypothetical protein